MSLSKLVGIVWVLLVSVWARGWEATHTWLLWAIFVVGVIYAVASILEWLGWLKFALPAPRRRAGAAAPAAGPAPEV